ncbi:MAG TPA: tetratricopeptide repeat protein [Verrucomicrobiae bacterium]|nr:tetratricopeptide repeat protein [Verrucomicrobiae bacterium]
MPNLSRCGRCGKALDASAAGGLCPACLIQDGLDALAQSFEPVTRQVRVTQTHSSVPQQRAFGDYELIEEIARGGMGVVYRARQLSLNRTVAVKLILSGQLAGPADVQRFRREAEAAANLQHPNIVAIHEVGEHQGHQYFSMDYVAGNNLAALVREGPLPAARAAGLVKTIAEAIHYAHTKGVLHRDLKPGNVLLDEHGQPRVTDFGLAKRLSDPELATRNSELTVSGQVLGTPSFMPPEQALGKREQIGPACDVYSLGAILYCLLTARAPFVGQSLEETLALVLGDDPVAPRRLNPAVARDLETICLKCLEKEPARRYATAQLLAQDLGRFLDHEPVQATPPTAIYRWQKFSRKHRTAVAAAALMVMSLVTATVVSMWFGLWANLERERAIDARKAESAQRKRAVAAKTEANERAADAQAVIAFLRDNILAAARPEGREGGLGWNVTVQRAVQAAEPQIALLFTNRPAVEAQIRDAVGATLLYLGDDTNAIRQLARALALRESRVGPCHADTLTSMHNLANAYRASGQLSNAIQQGETLLNRSSSLLAADSPEHLTFMNSLAVSYREKGQFTEAISLLERVVVLRKARFGPEDPATLNSMSNLAEAYRAAGQFTNALPLRREIFECRVRTRGPEDLDTVTEMSNLALVYRDLGQTSNAVPIMEEVLKLQKLRLAPDHPHVLTTMSSLGTMYRESGRIQEAMPLLKQALELALAQRGREHVNTIGAMNSLALAYLDNGQASNAVPLLKQAVELQSIRIGPDNPDTLAMKNNLAKAYQANGQSSEAMALLSETLEATKGKLAPEHPTSLILMNNFASLLQKAGGSADSAPLYEELLRLAQGALAPDHPSTLAIMNNLASAYAKAKKTAEAFSLWEQILPLATNRLEPGHPSRLAFMNNLGTAYMEAGQLSKAIPLFEQTLNEAKLTPGLENKDAESFIRNLALAYVATNRFAEAEPLLQRLLTAQRRTHSAEGATIATTLGQLGDALLRQEKYADAEKVLQERLDILKKKQPGLSVTFVAQSSLGLAFLRQNKLTEAELQLLQAYEGLQQRAAKKPSAARAQPIQDTAERLVQLYEAWGKPEQASEWRRKLSQSKGTSLDDARPPAD